MSVAQISHCKIRYRWCLSFMIPWYRQILALVFGLGVMLIALWAIENGSGKYLIGSVAGMAFITLLLIFGVEINEIRIDSLGIQVDFTNTGVTKTVTERRDDSYKTDDE